jgi:hypothetical protein
MNRRQLLHCTLWTIWIQLLACSGGPGPAPEGIWEGPNVTLELNQGRVTSFRLDKVSCAAITNDPDCDDVYPVSIEEAEAPLADGAFTMSRDYLQVDGTMDGNGASGTYHFVHAEGCCVLDGTWEAEPPEVLDCSGGKDTPGANAALEIGLSDPSDGSFTKLQSGDDLNVVRGFQGALMVVPTLRIKDLSQEQTEVEISIVNQSVGQTVGYIRIVEPFERSGSEGSTLFPDLFVLVACKVVCPVEEDQEELFLDQEVVVTPRFKNACGLDFEGEPVTLIMRQSY